jgi:hypothetical protein
MLAGAVVYLLGDRLRARWGTPLGLAMIGGATLFYDKSLPYPGYWAILPVLGTAMVVAARSLTPLLTNRPAQVLGNISYSVYLWHWPMVVATGYLGLSLSTATTAIIVAASTVLGYVSYRTVELPGKRLGSTVSGVPYLARSFSACSVIVVVALLALRTGGLPARIPELAARNDVTATDWQYPGRCVFADGICGLGAEAPLRVLFWGDSHAQQLYPALVTLLDSREIAGRQVLIASADGCLPVRGIDTDGGRKRCRLFNQRVFERSLQSDVQTVVIVSIWAPYFREELYDTRTRPTVCQMDGERCLPFATAAEGLASAGARLRADLGALIAHGKAVHLILPVPAYQRNVSSYMARQQWYGRPIDLHLSLEKHRALTEDVSSLLRRLARETGASVIDPADALCAGGECRFAKDGLALYRDNNHLAAGAAPMLVPLLRDIFP